MKILYFFLSKISGQSLKLRRLECRISWELVLNTCALCNAFCFHNCKSRFSVKNTVCCFIHSTHFYLLLLLYFLPSLSSSKSFSCRKIQASWFASKDSSHSEWHFQLPHLNTYLRVDSTGMKTKFYVYIWYKNYSVVLFLCDFQLHI